MFIDSYKKICALRGISPTCVLADLKISKSSYTHWKNGGEPLNKTKIKLAEYFKISVQELEFGEIKNPVTNNDDGTSEEVPKMIPL